MWRWRSIHRKPAAQYRCPWRLRAVVRSGRARARSRCARGAFRPGGRLELPRICPLRVRQRPFEAPPDGRWPRRAGPRRVGTLGALVRLARAKRPHPLPRRADRPQLCRQPGLPYARRHVDVAVVGRRVVVREGARGACGWIADSAKIRVRYSGGAAGTDGDGDTALSSASNSRSKGRSCSRLFSRRLRRRRY